MTKGYNGIVTSGESVIPERDHLGRYNKYRGQKVGWHSVYNPNTGNTTISSYGPYGSTREVVSDRLPYREQGDETTIFSFR